MQILFRSGYIVVKLVMFFFFTVDRYEISDVSIVFYLQEIPVNSPVVLVFEMEQKVYIPLPEPAKINVYDYYEPAVRTLRWLTLSKQLYFKIYEMPKNTCTTIKSG